MRTFYEFFAGGGMARLGLGSGWTCAYANDFCPKKAVAYSENFHPERINPKCISLVNPSELEGRADLAWASFPCQDLSLAGNMGGLAGERSGAFWPFWELMSLLAREGRRPRTIVIENVVGFLSSKGGQDFRDVCGALAKGGYRPGALIVDAVHFVPQSRKRVFIVAFDDSLDLRDVPISSYPSDLWHAKSMRAAVSRLDPEVSAKWLWLSPTLPIVPRPKLADIVTDEPEGIAWHSEEETRRLIEMMTPPNRKRLEDAISIGGRHVGTIYRRSRPQPGGRAVQRAEIRFDGIAGCLRTPAGGSSRQTVAIVQNGTIRTRLLSPREAARLMGVDDDYRLPSAYNEAYHLLGDGLVVPVVAFVADSLVIPALDGIPARNAA